MTIKFDINKHQPIIVVIYWRADGLGDKEAGITLAACDIAGSSEGKISGVMSR